MSTPLISELPPHLQERCAVLSDAPARAEGDFVVYWMHHAMRGHDNPALDTAKAYARALDKPLLVYQGLAGDHRFNSDRHHLFILQGARDVARALSEQDVAYRFHLPVAPGDAPLPRLLERAALAVFELMPVPPFSRWQPALARRYALPVVQVDARCIVPMPLPGRRFDRAFKLRDALKHEYRQRIAAGWSADDGETPASPAAMLDDLAPAFFDVGAMSDRELLAEIARLPIQHHIGPVADTPGGSEAGYARWRQFYERGLASYHKRRNDAAETWPRGVSRMSPYLHYGMVSPFRLAAEAAASGKGGADKFIEELTIWRELAHNFCLHCRDPESLSALPDWARETLAAHAGDRREKTLSLYALQQAESGDELWDLAQRSLLAHGELHNNLRMTWAKAIVQWTPSPDAALRALIDLNHRYALDGNDPSSYGGLLWALGLFDRPFEPENPVLGTVRGRSVEHHAKRLDVARYAAQIDRPQGRRYRVAIVGAGVAGLAAARALHDHNHEVVVFEKSRGPGGRTATRRHLDGRFDHGAQYFTCRDGRLSQHLPAWRDEGLIEAWPSRVDGERGGKHERWRGVDGMNALAKRLAGGLTVRTQTRVEGIHRDETHWRLTDDAGDALGEFDQVIVGAPAPQAAVLLRDAQADFAERAAAVRFDPCWAAMITSDAVDASHWQARFTDDAVIAWIGGRADGPRHRWVVHASPGWSSEHLEDDAAAVAESLQAAFEGQFDAAPAIHDVTVHRWRYARTDDALDVQCLYDDALGIGACGDWCHGGSRVENAWLSGHAIAGRVLASAALAAGVLQQTVLL